MTTSEEDYTLSVKGFVSCWKHLETSEETILEDVYDMIKRAFRVGYRIANGKETLKSDFFIVSTLEKMGVLTLNKNKELNKE